MLAKHVEEHYSCVSCGSEFTHEALLKYHLTWYDEASKSCLVKCKHTERKEIYNWMGDVKIHTHVHHTLNVPLDNHFRHYDDQTRSQPLTKDEKDKSENLLFSKFGEIKNGY